MNNHESSEVKPIDDKDKRCAPSKKFENGSCIPLSLLIRMANAYNKVHDNKIKLHSNVETLNPSKYKIYLVNSFNERLSKVCNDQKCWLEQGFIDEMKESFKTELKTNTLRPTGPEGKFTWLNTININDVMEQYENTYPDFKFLGAVPIDFDDLPPLGIKDIDLKKLETDGKKKIGIIYNLDEHYKSGSHWVASFTDLDKGQVYYFDSYGLAPEKRIRALLRRFSRYINDKKGVKLTVDYNKTRHQQKNSECGMYSIYFIHKMLKKGDFNKLNSKAIPDDKINSYRKFYFT